MFCVASTEGVFDEREEIAHHQHIAQEAHDEAAQRKDEDAVGLGTDIAEHIHDGEADDAHHLLAAEAHEIVEEGRERRHAYRRDEAYKLYVF